ncbi:MAG: chromate transporter, partial [candidate division NC10 bacterium]|nr:chromate transporter [candidate division NC10 bacterium]
MTADPGRLAELARLFLKLGLIGFGGPAAHIAMMEEEVVARRRWLSREHFLDLVGATNLIPGPNSTEMAIHVGYLRSGWAGLLIAGLCFIFPAVLITTGFAWAYVNFGTLPQVVPFLFGIKPALIAIILAAVW